MWRRYEYLVSVSAFALLVVAGARIAQADDTVSAPKPSPAATTANSSGNASPESDVIVTGTREAGRKVQDSPIPIQVIGNDALVATGQANALDALKAALPSLNTLAYGGDLTNLIRSFSLRGLSPDHTLVLINGKRRHQSAFINASGGPFNASNPVDLALIPVAMIDHIEVLLDGAAAQYGTDAIGGVINIILKSEDHGGTAAVLGGVTGHGDGFTAQPSADAGAKLGDDGFIHLGFDYDHHDHTNRSAYDPRTTPPYSVQGRITGDASYDTELLGFNLEKPINSDISVYGFGTFAHRYAESIQNYRIAGQFNNTLPKPAVGNAVNEVYPDGFFPVEAVDEYDFGLTAGVKGKSVLGWEWDLSSTYGYDIDSISTIHSINPIYSGTTGILQTNFNDGSFTAQQLTTALDLRRGFNTGLWSAPLNVAVGLEHRYETYQVGAGEPASYLYGGGSAYPGFTPTSASSSFRNVEAAYVDLSTRFVPQWQVDLAGRAENYENIGGALTGQVSSRYDFASWLGLRGTFGNGYHAPTLAQENYGATNVSPTSATAQLPVSSPGAAHLGASSLKPETSQNISVGLVSDPIPHLHATLDAYQITIDNRIIDTGVLTGQLALEAIALNGNVAPPTIPLSNIGAQFFANGVNTRTQGLDLNIDYTSDYGDLGTVKWYANGTYNYTKITKINEASAQMQAAHLSLVNPSTASYLTSASPRIRLQLGATWFLDKWELTLSEVRYGAASEWVNPSGNGKTFFKQTVDAAFLTNLDVKYNISPRWAVDVGALNLFNVEPTKTPPNSRGSTNAGQYATFSPFGINGGYYFARLTAKF